MINEILNNLASLTKSNIYIAPILVFLGGLITSFSPCSISNIPLLIAYLSGSKNCKTSTSVLISIFYAVGMSITFVILGIIVSIFGGMLGKQNRIINIILGTLMIVLSLQIFKIINIIPDVNVAIKTKRKGYMGAFIFGLIGGIMTSPCTTPILIAILSFLVQKKDIVYGSILMLFYSLGHSIILILSGLFIGFVKSINTNDKFKTIGIILNNILGTTVFILGVYILYINIF